MRTFLLVFDDGNGPDIDLNGFVNALDEDAEILTLEGHVGFIKSALSAEELSKRFAQFAGSSLYLITEMSKSAYAGRMFGEYWDFIKQDKALSSAA